REFLALYTERMTAVEGNTTFHHIPSRERVAGWAETMPPAFRICPKLHRSITHEGPLCERKADAADFLQPMKAFGDNLGPFHLQLPPRYGPENFADLRHFLSAWPREPAPVAVEVRHRQWYQSPAESRLDDLLDELGVGRVILDSRPIHERDLNPRLQSERDKPAVPLVTPRTAPFAVIRYISHPDIPQNDAYLEPWADRIAAWLEEGTQVYFFVHCPLERKSPRIAQRFQGMLEARDASVPPLPWNELGDRGQQTLL
ncbi:MAG: DUF72 domain-containing protein, partial [Bradymonadaceae bacterium]